MSAGVPLRYRVRELPLLVVAGEKLEIFDHERSRKAPDRRGGGQWEAEGGVFRAGSTFMPL